MLKPVETIEKYYRLLVELRYLCGFVENGTSDSISISQDDATYEWVCGVGVGRDKKYYHGNSFFSAIEKAVAANKFIEFKLWLKDIGDTINETQALDQFAQSNTYPNEFEEYYKGLVGL